MTQWCSWCRSWQSWRSRRPDASACGLISGAGRDPAGAGQGAVGSQAGLTVTSEPVQDIVQVGGRWVITLAEYCYVMYLSEEYDAVIDGG